MGLLLDSLAAEVVLGTLLAALLIVVWQGFNVAERIRLRHIPGPTPFWLLGNAHKVAWEFDMFLPAALQHWGEKYGPVFKMFVGLQPMIVIRDAEMVKTISVKHHKTFMDRALLQPPLPHTQHKVLTSGMLFARGTYWLGVRGAAQPLFHSAGLQSYVPLMDAAACQFRDSMKGAAASGQVVDVSAAMGNLSLKIIGESAFGIEIESLAPGAAGVTENTLVKSAHTILELAIASLATMVLTPPLLRPLVYNLLRRWPSLNPELGQLVAARGRIYTAAVLLTRNVTRRLGLEWSDPDGMQKEFVRAEGAQQVHDTYDHVVPSEGSLVHMLVRAKNKETGQPLTALQTVGQINAIMVAGHDTTTMLLTSFVYQVAKDPALQARVLEEVDTFGRHRDVTYEDLDKFPYMEAVMYECLRLMPPGPITTRRCLEDTTVHGVFIPKGSVVVFDIYGLHRDGRYWADPQELRPERMLQDSAEAKSRHQYAFLPFGVGARLCIGYKFAIQEAKIALVRLYQHYTCELADSQKVPAQLRYGITMGFKEGMQVKVQARA